MATEKLLNTDEAAEILRVSTWTLKSWRSTQATYIPTVNIGRKVFYKESVIKAVIDGKSFNTPSTSSPSTNK